MKNVASLVCFSGTPWLDHFAPPIGNGKGCLGCKLTPEMLTTSYEDFIEQKSQLSSQHGFEPRVMPEFLFPFQRALIEWAVRKGRAAIFADCGLGKGQPRGARVLIPTGWASNIDLNIGDYIVASNGRSYPILAKYERGVQPLYRITFSDGSSFIVDADHLHIFRTNNDRQRGNSWRIATTKELAMTRLRYGTANRSKTYNIPIVKPVVMKEQSHWIHPYVLGVLLGDGSLTKDCTITLADEQILSTVRSLLPEGWSLNHRSRYNYKLSCGGTNNRKFIGELRRLGLYGSHSPTKFIPLEYLIDSISNRVWLLRGLMDTDGYIKKSSQFYSTSESLKNDVLFIIRSLGGCPTQRKKQTSYTYKGEKRIGLPCHVLTFSLRTFNPFHLARKAVRWNPNPRDNGRWIEKIEPCGEGETICLAVSSPDQSYVTEQHIVTHNTPMQLVWAQNVVEHTNRPVLLLTPLAVGVQTVREGQKFRIDARQSRDGTVPHVGIVVTNYEKLHLFDSTQFSGLVCDESSILKHFSGATQKAVTRFALKLPYRLLCTATAAPNDYVELGTSSETLGELSHSEMLTRFFSQSERKPFCIEDVKQSRKDQYFAKLAFRVSQTIDQWHLKPYAEDSFWQWICSWARACRTPADMGFDDPRFILPALHEVDHTVKALSLPSGTLFPRMAVGLSEEREERRRTLLERCQAVADLVAHDQPAVVWCHLNDEGDTLTRMIPGARQIRGSDTDEKKEATFEDFAAGRLRVLITKPKIGAWGLNWQHCAHVVTFASHSYEQYYQSVRRCWRFGQTRPVRVDIIATEGEAAVRANMLRKSEAAIKMFERLVTHMSHALRVKKTRGMYETERPSWLSSTK